MADRRKLLSTGKNAARSVAGTVGSVAGTVAEGGREIAGKVRRDVQQRYEKLTDETVTDQERARLERARMEAEREARREAQRTFREEFAENAYDEAYQAELEDQQRRNTPGGGLGGLFSFGVGGGRDEEEDGVEENPPEPYIPGIGTGMGFDGPDDGDDKREPYIPDELF